MESNNLEIPWQPVPLGSPFYIQPAQLKELTYQEITKGGSLIRIKSPQKTGKTSLVIRLIAHAQSINYNIVYLDLHLAEESICTNIDNLLQWFCAHTSQQLQLPLRINEYYNEYVGSKVNCTLYFQEYILQQASSSIVLVFNELNRLFEYPNTAQHFLALLRSWYEEAKHNTIFKQLRFILVYSTEAYIDLNINQSPFNIGLPVSLPEFTVEQIQDLAQLHGLTWEGKVGRSNAFELHALVGGHPYLVRLALYDLAIHKTKSLNDFLEEAPTISGIYSAYLRGLLAVVIKNPELAAALQQLINNGGRARLNHIVTHKLESLGLVRVGDLESTFSCNLYRKYFSAQNLEELNVWQFMKNLQQDNQYLARLSNLDYITTLGNQRYFETSLNQIWSMVAEEEVPLSVILLDIDHFKIYNRQHSWEAGNLSLQQIADVIDDTINRFYIVGTFMMKAARFGGGEFGILLPGRGANIAFEIAENIRAKVFNLGISHSDSVIFGLAASVLTVSSGVACTFINDNVSPSILMQATRDALYQSKRNGRNNTSVSTTFNCGFIAI